MNLGADAANQMVSFYIETLRTATTITGKGAEHVAALLLNLIKEQKQTKGKTRLNSMIKSGKELKVFTIQKKDLPKFAKEAKSYGVLYSALINRKNKNIDGMVDIMVRNEDASKINRIVERFKLTTSDVAQIKTNVQNELNELRNKEEQNALNFNMAKTDKSPLLEPYSMISKEDNIDNTKFRKSVKSELNEIKEDIKNKKDLNIKKKTREKSVKIGETKKKKDKVK